MKHVWVIGKCGVIYKLGRILVRGEGMTNLPATILTDQEP